MNLRSIEYFLTAAEEGNVTRAADRLFISQQALSSHIKRLEDEYGVLLFERKPTFHLTLAGEQMVFYGRQLLNAEAKMRAAFSDIDKNHRGVLRVGISRLRCEVFFPVIWQFYHDSHPNISLEVVNGNTIALEEKLQLGKIDLYIGVDAPAGSNREMVELVKERIHCCFSESLLRKYYPDSENKILEEFQKDGADLTRILRLPFITVCRGNRLRRGIDEFFMANRLPQFVLECDEQRLAYKLAREGNGASLISPVVLWKSYYEENERGEKFHAYPVKNGIPENTVFLVYRSDYGLPRYAMDFAQDAAMVFRNYARSIQRHFG